MGKFSIGDTVVRTSGQNLKDWKMVLGRRLTVVDCGDDWVELLS